MNMISKANQVNKWAGTLCSISLIVIALIACYEIVMRAGFTKPTTWALDYQIYLFIWFGFLAIGFTQQQRRHIKVDILTTRFSPGTRLCWDIMCHFFGLLFVASLVIYGISGVSESLRLGEYSSSGLLRTPLWIPRIGIPLGALLLGIQFITDIFSDISRLRQESQVQNAAWHNKPSVIIPIFLALVVISVVLMQINVLVGFLVLLVIFLMGGVPIWLSLFTVGLLGLYSGYGGLAALPPISSIAFQSLDNFALVCLPLFILSGAILDKSGIGEELFNFFGAWLGRVPGGLAVGTIGACVLFAAISTSSVATCATIGIMAIPALALRKYDKQLSYGVLAAGGTLGIMIPPAGALIIYSAITDESLGRLFMAGVLPGLLLASLFAIFAAVMCAWKKKYEKLPAVTWRERGKLTRSAVWAFLFPVIILGGIYSGIFTALEAGAAAVMYAVFVFVIRKKTKFRQFPEVLAHSAVTASSIIAIIIGAITMGYLFTLLRVPNTVLDLITGLGLSRWGVLFLLTIFYLILGCFLEVVSQMVITLPIVYPLIISLGFDGIWFAVYLTILMELSLLTPPVGLNLYVVQSISKGNIATIIKGTIPFWIIMIIVMIIISVFPQIALFLPSKIVG